MEKTTIGAAYWKIQAQSLGRQLAECREGLDECHAALSAATDVPLLGKYAALFTENRLLYKMLAEVGADTEVLKLVAENTTAEAERVKRLESENKRLHQCKCACQAMRDAYRYSDVAVPAVARERDAVIKAANDYDAALAEGEGERCHA